MGLSFTLCWVSLPTSFYLRSKHLCQLCVQQFLYACLLHLLYFFVLTIIYEIYMLKVESKCWNLNLPMYCFNAFYLESIALWVNSYAKLFDAYLESTIHEKFLLIWFSCLLVIYLLANYKPLPWVTSFITWAL